MADFFDKITGGIDKGIKAFSAKGKELIETTRLKGEIKDVQNAVETRFRALGTKVFEMINRDGLNEEELKAECAQIASLYKRITELEETIKKVELEALSVRAGFDAIMCPKCGAANKSGDKFCTGCGSAFASVAASGGAACQTCGSELQEGAKFCSRCGGKIGL